MERLLLYLLAAAFCFTGEVVFAKLTKDDIVTRCKEVPRQELEPCLVKLINDLQPQFGEGIPEFGLAPSEEVDIDEFNITEIASNSYIDGSFYNLKVKGFHEMELTKLKLDYDTHNATFVFHIPDFRLTGRYILNASFVFLPLQGDGTFWMNLRNVDVNGYMVFNVKMVNGDYRMNPTKAGFDFDYNEIGLRLNNLFNGNPVLKETADSVVQRSAREMIDALKPHIIDSIVELAFERGVAIGNNIPFEDMAGNQYLRKEFNIP